MFDLPLAEALHRAMLACLEAFGAKRDADKIAKLRAAVAEIPPFTENPFAQAKVVREWGQSETSWHAVVLATARRWVEDNRHCESATGELTAPSPAGNCMQLVTLPILQPTPSEVRAELEAEMNRVRAAAPSAPASEPLPAAVEAADDPTAYRPASEFIAPERFPTLKAINKALAKNPSIRWRRPTGKNGKPIPNRLTIHAGDWHDFIHRKQSVSGLDQPAHVVDEVIEIEKRKAEIRNPTGQ
jgi:hypothetical protein